MQDTHLSFHYEEGAATVTASEDILTSLLQQLREEKMTAKESGLRGRLHSNCHRGVLPSVLDFCDTNDAFQFPVMPSNAAAPQCRLHQIALRSILVEECNWYGTTSALQVCREPTKDDLLVYFGFEDFVPPSVARKLGANLIRVPGFDIEPVLSPAFESRAGHSRKPKDEDIAVVGMSCKVAGADDVDEFWELLCKGESQHVPVPEERIRFETAWRERDPKKKWFGNFIRDFDAFDHKFFNKSPREISSTDPQQRLMLQVAYQAVEQSGWFQTQRKDGHVGCYIGVGLVDYEQNIASHPPNAYTATGNLKSFVAGKISHHFNWTGPAQTIDTACSSSAVAIHQACKAILTDDCNTALAGGVHVMTSPLWFQNLAEASFLSPTGNCKPFDACADGYCRGEGAGAVLLKKLSAAVQDGNQIFGIIRSTAVSQSINSTPITTPNTASLSNLFQNVTARAGLNTNQISVIEAHGTGTKIGDPVEIEGIQAIFESQRRDIASVGSVKGLVGHTETASGIVSLVKILLMLHWAVIPPQASFSKLNPRIKASSNLEISTSLKAWRVKFRAAMINNYGASGSNASMVVIEAPLPSFVPFQKTQAHRQDVSYPFWICGADAESVRSCCGRLRRFLEAREASAAYQSLPDLAFNLSRQSNRTLSYNSTFSCSNMTEMRERLLSIEKGDASVASSPSPRPLIFCFGGQVSTFVGLDKRLYNSTKILRYYLDRCDAECVSLKLPSIYPAIFSETPEPEIVKLQTMLFALQYSCAKAWMDCGAVPTALVGHSFGELTALCVSGSLSLSDALKMISRRASVIQQTWGNDKGAMMAVECELSMVQRLRDASIKFCGGQTTAAIACYNGPRNFTLAGSTKSIDALEEAVRDDIRISSVVKTKRLNVSHAFHSDLIDPLMEELTTLTDDLVLETPIIPLERATESDNVSSRLNTDFVATHARFPVYFESAVQRLAKKYPSCIWLEVGSRSTITTMVSRALNSPKNCHFQPINLTSGSAMQNLVDATINLWREGLRTLLWPHHQMQTPEYNPILLPPYQFRKSSHWLEIKKPRQSIQILQQPCNDDSQTWAFVEYQNCEKTSARFEIRTSEKFRKALAGHTLADTTQTCPATFQLEIAIEALNTLRPRSGDDYQPVLQGLNNHAPICIDDSKVIFLDAEATTIDKYSWAFKVVSQNSDGSSTPTLHTTGSISFRPTYDEQIENEISRYERLCDHNRCLRLLDSNETVDAIQGRCIYKTFAGVVRYGREFQGLQRIVGRAGESAGRVAMAHSGESWLDPLLSDNFCQVAGIFINCMAETLTSEIYVGTGIEGWLRSSKLQTATAKPQVWDVLALHRGPSNGKWISDVFVFDPRSGSLVEVILGICYRKIKTSLIRTLSRPSPGTKAPGRATFKPSLDINVAYPEEPYSSDDLDTALNAAAQNGNTSKSLNGPDLIASVKKVIGKVSGLELGDIDDEAILSNLGIDSLMSIEISREIEATVGCSTELVLGALIGANDIQSLAEALQTGLAQSEDSSFARDDVSLAIDSAYQTSMENSPQDKEFAAPESEEVLAAKQNSEGVVNNSGLAITNCLAHVEQGINDSRIKISKTAILAEFQSIKKATDEYIFKHNLADYAEQVLPKQTELCVAHIVDTFEKLGCGLKDARPGQDINRINYRGKHSQFIDCLFIDRLYKILEQDGGLVDISGEQIQRTAMPCPSTSAVDLFQDLLTNFPDHANEHKLIQLAGSKLDVCLEGKAESVNVLFGTADARELLVHLYASSPINLAFLKQMESLLRSLLFQTVRNTEPVKIFEMGAGTGGTAVGLVAMLALEGVPVEYTFSDISPSLVAAARRRFAKYPFMRFCTHDISMAPPPELLHSQHIVISTNGVHATPSLEKSAAYIRQMLCPGGFLMLLEMTTHMSWTDMVFGQLEGWWLFDDGREHVDADEQMWERSLKSAGYEVVEWTEGQRPEARLQRIFIAL